MRRLLFAWDDFECAPRCSAHNQRKDYFIFRNTGASADAPVFHFHRWGRNGKRQLQRRFLRKRSAAERFPADLQRAEPSQALPRQLSQGESQAVKFITKVLGIMRKLPAVLLALPLGELSPQVTERAHTDALSAEVSDAIRSFPATQKSSPFRGSWRTNVSLRGFITQTAPRRSLRRPLPHRQRPVWSCPLRLWSWCRSHDRHSAEQR